MKYYIHNLHTEETYVASTLDDAKDEVDRSALRSAMDLDETISMGNIVVTPERFMNELK